MSGVWLDAPGSPRLHRLGLPGRRRLAGQLELLPLHHELLPLHLELLALELDVLPFELDERRELLLDPREARRDGGYAGVAVRRAASRGRASGRAGARGPPAAARRDRPLPRAAGSRGPARAGSWAATSAFAPLGEACNLLDRLEQGARALAAVPASRREPVLGLERLQRGLGLGVEAAPRSIESTASRSYATAVSTCGGWRARPAVHDRRGEALACACGSAPASRSAEARGSRGRTR